MAVQGILKQSKDLVVKRFSFDDDSPILTRLVIVDSPSKPILLVDSMAPIIVLCALKFYGLTEQFKKGMSV